MARVGPQRLGVSHLDLPLCPKAGLCWGTRTLHPTCPAMGNWQGGQDAGRHPPPIVSRLLRMVLVWKRLHAGALQQQGRESQSALLLSIRESLKVTCQLTEAAAARKFPHIPPPLFFFLNDSNVLIKLG